MNCIYVIHGNLNEIYNRYFEEIIKHVQKLLVTLHLNEEGKKNLEKIETPCFVEANNTTYQPVIEFIKKFELYIHNPRELK